MRALAHDHLTAASRRTPERVSLIVADATYSFGEIDRSSGALATWLQDAGIMRGDRVALFLDNSAELVIAVWAVFKAGGVTVAINPATKTDKLAYMLGDSDVRCVVTHRRLGGMVRDAVDRAPGVKATLWVGGVPDWRTDGTAFEDVVPAGGAADALGSPDGRGLAERRFVDPGLIDQDLAAIVYTSGSTGRPKGVMLTHRNINHNAWSIAESLRLRPDDIIGCVLSLSFTYGLFQVLTAAQVGCSVLLERSFAYPYEVLRRIATHRVTVLPGVPTIYATILQMTPLDGLDLSSLRMLTNAAAALPIAHVERLGELLPNAGLYQMYGLTECTRVCCLDPEHLAERPGSVGRAIPNTEAFVVDDEGRRVPPGTVGELVVRGAHVMRGYWGLPEETALRLRDGHLAGEKVLYTGDEFWQDGDGFLYFVGRKDDIFKSRGEKISPVEIERVLYELDEVTEAAVVGIPDEIEGNAIKAFVVLREGAALSGDDIRRHCRVRLESSHVPRDVEVRGALPKTDSGKIRKADLR